MECVCGCGREYDSKVDGERNYIAAQVALELLAWDKNRASPGAGPDGREGLIARGADCYAQLLYVLHGEGAGAPDAACREWLDESAAMRSGHSGMNKFQLFGTRPPALGKADMDLLDRKHPELSFSRLGSGRAAEPAVATAPAAGDDDLVGRLERLRALREDGTLTEDEFAAAKARLLGDA
jgi:hypothetical protein